MLAVFGISLSCSPADAFQLKTSPWAITLTCQDLDFLRNYDTAKSSLQAIVDMPDRLIDLFIRLCVQNKGVLSAAKRKNHFAMLTDEEVSQMQQAIKESHLVE